MELNLVQVRKDYPVGFAPPVECHTGFSGSTVETARYTAYILSLSTDSWSAGCQLPAISYP
jgi:hypothetical protein